jgi:cytoskeletal protein CcmA (bactofilin family)
MAWNSSKESKNTKTTPQGIPSNSINSIVQGTELQGTITAASDIRIDGMLKGNLDCKGKVIIGPTGTVDGDIQCENAVIEGFFSGLLIVSELLHVRETAKIEGDVHTKKLIVQSGSSFNVSCKMGAQKSKQLKTDAKSIEMEKLSKIS